MSTAFVAFVGLLLLLGCYKFIEIAFRWAYKLRWIVNLQHSLITRPGRSISYFSIRAFNRPVFEYKTRPAAAPVECACPICSKLRQAAKEQDEFYQQSPAAQEALKSYGEYAKREMERAGDLKKAAIDVEKRYEGTFAQFTKNGLIQHTHDRGSISYLDEHGNIVTSSGS